MKKTFLFILAIGFLVFAFLGFKAAVKIDQKTPANQTQVAGEDLDGNQKNLLVLQVDDLGSKNAQLVSAWGSLIVYSSPPQLMWVRLYPAVSADLTSTLQSYFQMADIGMLDPRTIAAFRTEYDLTIDGYMIIDTTAFKSFQTWTGTQSDTTTTGILVIENEVLTNVCRIFKKDGARALLNKIRWKDLIPGHFSTDLSFETMMLGMDIFKTSGKLNSCEIILNP